MDQAYCSISIVNVTLSETCEDGRTLVKVPMVINVSFFFGLPSPYRLFKASLIAAFLFASSIASSLAIALLEVTVD